jgi:hypothetical protein
MDLLYGDPTTRLTFGFTVARYNIGGGDDPTHTHMRPDAQMEGFQSGAAIDGRNLVRQRLNLGCTHREIRIEQVCEANAVRLGR